MPKRPGSGACHTEEDNDCTTKSHHVVIAKSTDSFTQLRARNGGDLVNHHAAGLSDPIRRIRIHLKPEQRRFGGICGERADGHGRSGIETVVLDDDDRTRLSDVPAACSGGPDVTPLHSSSELTASMNA